MPAARYQGQISAHPHGRSTARWLPSDHRCRLSYRSSFTRSIVAVWLTWRRPRISDKTALLWRAIVDVICFTIMNHFGIQAANSPGYSSRPMAGAAGRRYRQSPLNDGNRPDRGCWFADHVRSSKTWLSVSSLVEIVTSFGLVACNIVGTTPAGGGSPIFEGGGRRLRF